MDMAGSCVLLGQFTHIESMNSIKFGSIFDSLPWGARHLIFRFY